jgi:hypothetical protein
MSNDLKFYIYDLETFPNCFLFSGKFFNEDKFHTFELSSRKNMRGELLSWLSYLQNSGVQMVGYNNIGFDYPLIHDLLNNPYTFTCEMAYQLCQQIINSQGYGFTALQLKDRILPQIDLAKINHFDNANKRTSLKSLQVAMRSQSVEDLPFPPGTILTPEQMDVMIHYNCHDLTETEAFLKKNLHLIAMRKELLDTKVLTGDVFNFSDVKIGTEYLIKKIGRAKCFTGNKPRQTFRESVEFKDIILPKIFYRTEQFQEVLDWFNKQVIYTGAEQRPHLEKKLAGIEFHFGVGGVHASVENRKFESNDTHVIKDIDVAGMYVAVAIVNGFFPEHLGKEFLDAYKQLQADRAMYKKGTTMNAVLKLAGNGVYGNSDNKYSCFYDPRYPKQITVNGQLQLLQLVEVLSMIPGLEIIQANTDGITAYVPRALAHLFDLWKTDWEAMTGLKLEEVEYSKMWIRDVNNYLCVTTKGAIKRKGAYWYPTEEKEYEGVWNKDFSMMVVQKVTEQTLINGWNPEALIKLMTDPFDFMLRYKTPSGSTVYIGDKPMLKTVRYYVSTKGQPMRKVSQARGPIGEYKRATKVSEADYATVMKEIGFGKWDARIHTKAKTKYEQVVIGVESGKLTKECNDASRFDWTDVDYGYYIEEVKKLLIGE